MQSIENAVHITLAGGFGQFTSNDGERWPKTLRLLPSHLSVLDTIVYNAMQAGFAQPMLTLQGYFREQYRKGFPSVDLYTKLDGGVSCKFAWQEGNGGAVKALVAALGVVDPKTQKVVVQFGDMPYFKPATLQEILRFHETHQADITIGVVDQGRFVGEQSNLAERMRSWFRVIEPVNQVVEMTSGDAVHDERYISPSLFVFDLEKLGGWANETQKLPTASKGEHTLPQLVNLALSQGCSARTWVIKDPTEAVPVEVAEDLQLHP